MGLTAKDIEWDKLERDKNAYVVYQVKNPEAVQKFMDNKKLQEFLTADYDGDGSKRGCRLAISYNKEKSALYIGRQTGPNTDIPVACADLARSLVTFIFAPSEYDYRSTGLYDITAGLSTAWRDRQRKDAYDPPEAHKACLEEIEKSKWTRAKEFVLESESPKPSEKKSDAPKAKT
jgi:hypothetical protein